jgi:hypothetical protein
MMSSPIWSSERLTPAVFDHTTTNKASFSSSDEDRRTSSLSKRKRSEIVVSREMSLQQEDLQVSSGDHNERSRSISHCSIDSNDSGSSSERCHSVAERIEQSPSSSKRAKKNQATLRHLSFLQPVVNYRRGKDGRRGAICISVDDHADALMLNLAAATVSDESSGTADDGGADAMDISNTPRVGGCVSGVGSISGVNSTIGSTLSKSNATTVLDEL